MRGHAQKFKAFAACGIGVAVGVLSPMSAYAAAAVPAPAVVAAGPAVSVIVRYDPGGQEAARHAVTRMGGTIGRPLALIGGFTAKLPAGGLTALSAARGVTAVTPDAAVWMTSTTDEYGQQTNKDWIADSDRNSMYAVTKSMGAHDVRTRTDSNGRKVLGTGIGVALIDTGVAPVKGLTTTGKVINGPDLSVESQATNLRYQDTFGHGTHMAGIIAGRDPDVAAGNENTFNSFVGVAPGAHVLSVKVASADGATDVSQVLAAIDWVVQHRNDTGLNIRVLNLSFGTDSTQDARLDPMSFAVEAAWRAGIVVVVAVGNDGAQTRVSMPSANPYVIAVGAVNSMQTENRADDLQAEFSTMGNATRHADILASGRSLVSLRNPGSYIDTMFPEGRVVNDPAQRYFRGSGTSQATAVVSGAAALMLQHRPNLTPDQVKKLMTSTAFRAATADPFNVGQLDVKMAVEAQVPGTAAVQTYPAATGTGSLELSRGTAHIADPENAIELRGEMDIFGRAFSSSAWAKLAKAGTSWTGGFWNGNEWTGTAWTGTSWTGRTWSGRTWSGTSWSGRTWSGRTWSAAVWTTGGWSGRTWSGRTWSGRTWSHGSWA